MADPGPLSEQHPEYVLGHVLQALSEDPRVSEMDVRVELGERTLRLEGCVTTSEHRAALEQVAAELVPQWRVDNRIEVRQFAAPDSAESIDVAPKDGSP